MKIFEGRFEWSGIIRWVSFCYLEIYENNEKYYIIATEDKNNTGSSITNSVENLYPQVCKKFNIQETDAVFIEHYEENSSRNFETEEETFDLVEIEDGKPNWKRIKKEVVEEWIKENNMIEIPSSRLSKID